MAGFTKSNSDLRAVNNFDLGQYINDGVKVTGYISGTTLTVVGVPSSAVAAGTALAPKYLLGPGVAVGTTVNAVTGAPATPTSLTVSVAQTLGSATAPVDFVVRSFVDAGVVIQPQGPKLQFFTIKKTGLAPAFADAIMKVVQQRATVHIYEVRNADDISVATYGTECWTAADLTTELNAAGLAVTSVVAGAAFTA